MRHVLLAVLSVLVAGCGELNPAYCRAHPEDPDCPRGDAGTDGAGASCDDGDDCALATPICKQPEAVCVQCTDSSHCTGTRPVCDTSVDACRGCTEHADCASNVCLVDGSCAAETDVKYVMVGGGGNACTRAMPCANFREVFRDPQRPYIKVTGAIVDDRVIDVDNRTVSILGDPGSSISRSNNGDIFTIKGSSMVGFVQLALNGAQQGSAIVLQNTASVALDRVDVHGNGGNGIEHDSTGTLGLVRSRVRDNTASGILLTRGTVTATRSLFYGNTTIGISSGGSADKVTLDGCVVANNPGGGLNLTSDFAITNSVISANGSNSSSIGGAQLSTILATSVFQFNTVANNTTNINVSAGRRGLNCIGANVAVGNSILTNNEILGACTVTYSLATTAIAGAGNRTGDPAFVDTATDPRSAGFYRIGATSAAKDGASPNAINATDIDGEARPMGGATADMGADEIP